MIGALSWHGDFIDHIKVTNQICQQKNLGDERNLRCDMIREKGKISEKVTFVSIDFFMMTFSCSVQASSLC